MNAAVLISVVSLVVSSLSILLAVRTRSALSRRDQLPQPSVLPTPIKSAPAQQRTKWWQMLQPEWKGPKGWDKPLRTEEEAGVEEWPDWTVPVNYLIPQDEEEKERVSRDPGFRVRVQ